MEPTSSSANPALVIGILVLGLIIGGAAGYYYATMKAPVVAPSQTTAASDNPYAQVQTNPYDNVQVNPFQ